MRKTRNLLETVRRPSINAQTLEPFSFTRSRTRKIFLEHETSPQRNFILRPTAVDAPPTRFRHSKHWQIPRLAYANQTARGVRDAPQSGKKVASRAYGGNRPFLNEGTNQKSLNRHNEPLTIEQVRELLNKNK